MSKASKSTQRLGRPPGEKLTPERAERLKTIIESKGYRLNKRFHFDVWTKLKTPEYAQDGAPSSVESVGYTFMKAFAYKRPLPEHYLRAVADLCGTTRDKLLPRESPIEPEPAPIPPSSGASTAAMISKCEHDQLPPDLLKSLPATALKGYIVAALLESRGKDAVANALAEILMPESINILAEKLVHDSVENFVDFYWGDYDFPPNIKRAVAAVIAANPTLRTELAAKVARSGYLDLASWFAVFSSFCPHEVAVQVERAFMDFAKEPSFREEYEWRGLHDWPNLISYFSKFGCVSAVHVLQDMGFEHVIKCIQEAATIDPEDLERFVSLIGKEKCLARMEESLDKKQMASLRRQLDQTALGKR